MRLVVELSVPTLVDGPCGTRRMPTEASTGNQPKDLVQLGTNAEDSGALTEVVQRRPPRMRNSRRACEW